MKLPNFLEYAPLNELRHQMQAELGDFVVARIGTRLTADEISRLSREGLEISADEIEVGSDGTLSYRGQIVLLYIRDPGGNEPKFHVSDCDTLESQRQAKRYDKYVIATRHDGMFEVNVMTESRRRERRVLRLDVCKNCLSKLAWNGYAPEMRAVDRNKIVSKFRIDEFFEHYRNPLISKLPTYSALTIPANEYNADFHETSVRIREARGWRCEGKGGRQFLKKQEREFLHVHHINGLKGDDRDENFRVLCIGCHSNEPKHSHMRNSAQYRKYREMFGRSSCQDK